MRFTGIALLISLLILLSCTKPPDYPDTPEIEFKSVNKSSFLQATNDSLLISFTFTDGDGDIGLESNDRNIFFKDLRTNTSELGFSVPEIPDQGVGNGISGEITCYLPMYLICCLQPEFNLACDQVLIERDTLVYEIFLEDQAGNVSNTIRTDPIILICD